MDLLDCPIQPYDWGSPTAIAEIQGRRPTGRPEAELWIGAHPSAPSRLVRDGAPVGLDEVIAAEPMTELGAAAARWGDRLPFLMKILAAAEPLSLQAHPSSAQARAGFAAEEAAGLAATSPKRLFRDPSHKPELICALGPFAALCGFREVERSLQLLAGLDAGAVGHRLVDGLRSRPDADGLRDLMVTALHLSADEAAPSLAAMRLAAARIVEGFGPECEWLVRLIDRRPADPAVFVAALLDLVVLAPGEALFLAAGILHTYLGGVGVEVMANSDNVLRGGLTSKHVDIDALAGVVVTEPGRVRVQRPGAPLWTYESPADEFALRRLVLTGHQPVDLPPGPALGVVVEGEVAVTGSTRPCRLVSGQAVWLGATDASLAVHGHGTCFVATPGPGRSA